jgi:peptidoglycan hydrolase-like protein with peptidoglycan-binding domain
VRVLNSEELAEVGQSAELKQIFTRDLEEGMEGDDVLVLQVFLNSKGFLVAQTGAGSPGLETKYFGTRTKAALAKYQASVGITPAVGYFGPKTRAYVALNN